MLYYHQAPPTMSLIFPKKKIFWYTPRIMKLVFFLLITATSSRRKATTAATSSFLTKWRRKPNMLLLKKHDALKNNTNSILLSTFHFKVSFIDCKIHKDTTATTVLCFKRMWHTLNQMELLNGKSYKYIISNIIMSLEI